MRSVSVLDILEAGYCRRIARDNFLNTWTSRSLGFVFREQHRIRSHKHDSQAHPTEQTWSIYSTRWGSSRMLTLRYIDDTTLNVPLTIIVINWRDRLGRVCFQVLAHRIGSIERPSSVLNLLRHFPALIIDSGLGV